MLGRGEHLVTAGLIELEASVSGLDPEMQSMSSIKKNTNKRRFSEEQTRSMELLYMSDCRPETEIKQQLANELGLQPQQVAIWFQNRRARLKTKQIERDYNIMRANYDTLLSRFESLQRENQSMLVQKLKNSLEKQPPNRSFGQEQAGESCDGLCRNSFSKPQQNGKNKIYFEGSDYQADKASSDDGSRKSESIWGKNEIVKKAESTDASMTSLEPYGNVEPSSFLNESICSSQWWEFWP